MSFSTCTLKTPLFKEPLLARPGADTSNWKRSTFIQIRHFTDTR